MPSDLPKNVIKLVAALLKHQAEIWLGKEALGIAGGTLVEMGGEEIQKKVDDLLSTQAGEVELLKAAQRADEYFREHCQDPTLRQAFTLSFGNLESVQAAIAELPTAMDSSQVESALQEALRRDIPSLTPEQVTEGARLYAVSLQHALLPIKDFTLNIIGQTVLANQNKLVELGKGQEKAVTLLEEIQRGIEQSLPSKVSAPALPGSLPAGSYVPFARNVLFTGRESDLQTLAGNLLPEEPTVNVVAQAVSGMGGIGKTQLAVEFAWRYGYRFKGVHWLDLSNPQALNAAISLCGTHMGHAHMDQGEQVAATLQSWIADGPRLLILDNFEDLARSNDVLVHFQHPALRLLITSRRKDFPRSTGLHVQELDLFNKEESLAFLERVLQQTEIAAARMTLAEKLGYLPLALELAASYININQIEVQKYLQELADVLRHESMQAEWFQGLEITNPTKHDQSLFATFQLSWREVKESTQQKIFMLAGYCAPNTPIPLEIFHTTLGVEAKILPALYRLGALGLLRAADKVPSIHPLLASYARSLADPSAGLLKNLASSLARLASAANDQMDRTGRLECFLPLRPHVLSTAEFAEGAGIQDAADLLGSLGYYLDKVADYPGAKAAMERALEIDEAVLEPDPLRVAMRLNNLGNVLKSLGDLAGARAAFERALKIHEASLGPDDPHVANCLNSLGLVLQHLGDLTGAKAAFARALKIDETTFGPDHPSVANSINNLGLVLQHLGDSFAAKAAFERALKIDETAFGADHPIVATVVNNLGSVLQDLGDLAGAKAEYERALKIGEISLGPDHPSVAVRLNNLGLVLQELRDLDGAQAVFERALKIDEAALGPGHPNVARDINNLGSVLQDLGDLANAQAAFARALKIDEAVFGPSHPDVATDVNNLGYVLKGLGDLAGAKAQFERALKIDEAILGPDHPHVAIRLSNLGFVLHSLGDLAGAQAAFERALKIDEAIFGSNHPDVATDATNLGYVLQDLGDWAGAQAAFARALKIVQKSSPAEDPNAQTTKLENS